MVSSPAAASGTTLRWITALRDRQQSRGTAAVAFRALAEASAGTDNCEFSGTDNCELWGLLLQAELMSLFTVFEKQAFRVLALRHAPTGHPPGIRRGQTLFRSAWTGLISPRPLHDQLPRASMVGARLPLNLMLHRCCS
jgi:hypothetical protein